MLTDTVILIDSEREYYICLTTKNPILERRLHKSCNRHQKFHYSILTPTIDKEPILLISLLTDQYPVLFIILHWYIRLIFRIRSISVIPRSTVLYHIVYENKRQHRRKRKYCKERTSSNVVKSSNSER